MEDNILDERFEDILVQGLTEDYEFVKVTSFHSPNFDIDDIQSMMRNLYIDRLSRSGHVHEQYTEKAAAITNWASKQDVEDYSDKSFGSFVWNVVESAGYEDLVEPQRFFGLSPTHGPKLLAYCSLDQIISGRKKSIATCRLQELTANGGRGREYM